MTKKEIIKIAIRVENVNEPKHEDKIKVFRETLKYFLNDALETVEKCKKDLKTLDEYEKWLKGDV